MTETKRVPGPAYRVETARLVLRCWHPEDAPLLKAALDANVEHLKPWMPWAHAEPEELQTKIDRLRLFRGNFDLGRDFVYAVFDPAETHVLGGSGLHTRVGEAAREIGYWVHVDHIRQGYATELSAALTRVAFDVDGVERVEIHCDPKNTASASVPRKLGFAHDATLRARMKTHDGSPRDAMIWSLLADEYPSTPCASIDIRAFDAAGRRIL